MTQLAFVYSQDAADAEAYWRTRDFKVFAVDVVAGKDRQPSFGRTFYARSRTADGAIRAVKRDAFELPRQARFRARLAGPRELGCVST